MVRDAANSRALSLVAEQPGVREWALGDAVRLTYTLETYWDTEVFCTKDGRLLSSYFIEVPTQSVAHRARRLLLVRNATMQHAGRYLCHARTRFSNLTRTVGWKVRLRSPSFCPATEACRETAEMPCQPCMCPPRKRFYGRNRVFRCYDEQRLLDIKLPAQVYHFRQFEPMIVDYELTTFGDTQVSWVVGGVIRQSHTVLLDTLETIVTLQKRLVVAITLDHDDQYEGTIEAQVRGTELGTSRTARIVMTYVTPGSACSGHSCSVINAECMGGLRCECPQNWVENHFQHICKRHCDDSSDCYDLQGPADCNGRDCDCAEGHILRDMRCTRLECVSHSECSQRHGRSFCHRGYCFCLAGYVLTNGRCEPINCLQANECPEEDMHCVRGHCVCNSQFDLIENTCRKSDVGACPPTGQGSCQVEHSVCEPEDNQCRCMPGYRAITVLGGKECLRVVCEDNICNVTNAKCVNGMCLCPNGRAPTSAVCFTHAGLTVDEMLGSVKLATLSVGVFISVIVFAAVTMTCMKSKEDYISSIEDDKPIEDEGAIMAAKKVRELEEELSKPLEPPPEEGVMKTFMRSLFPKLTDGLFGEHGQESRISFGNTDISSSLNI